MLVNSVLMSTLGPKSSSLTNKIEFKKYDLNTANKLTQKIIIRYSESTLKC